MEVSLFFRKVFFGKKGGETIYHIFYSVLVLSALVSLNYLASSNELFRIDTTENDVYTLSLQTEKLLNSLDKELVVRGFCRDGELRKEDLLLLKLAAERSSKLTWRAIDPLAEPMLAQRYNISELDSYHLSFSGDGVSRQMTISDGLSEQKFASALLKLQRGEAKEVLWSWGHSEGNPEDKQKGGYSKLMAAIEGENFRLFKFALSGGAKGIKGAVLLLVVNPKVEFLAQEWKRLNELVDSGMNVIFLLEPRTVEFFSKELENYGFLLKKSVVVDEFDTAFSNTSLGVQPVVNYYGSHPISAGLSGASVFSSACAVSRVGGGHGSNFAFSGPNSWAESDIDTLYSDEPQASLDLGEGDLAGPIPLASAHELGEGKARISVICDSDFIANGNFSKLANSDFFLNTLNWTAGEPEQITIRPRVLRESTKGLSEREFSYLFLSSVVIFPEFLALIGVFIWFYRRGIEGERRDS